MIYIRKFNYEYTDDQYADVDFTAADIVDAQYSKAYGYEGQADIESLPKPLRGSDLINAETLIPDVLLDDKASPEARTAALRCMQIPFFNQALIDERLYMGIVTSYANRRYAVTKQDIIVHAGDDDYPVSILSSSYGAGSVMGTALIGQPGCGKTTSLTMAVRRYPTAVRHMTDDGWYIQIPIIRTTAYSCSNISSLLQSFARRLDEILDTGKLHRDCLPQTNLGSMCGRIIDWIQRYHIGCWVIEEISFFSFASGSSKSFENIVTIMAETGVFIMATGNPDFYQKIDGNLRMERRLLGSFIDMDEVSQNKSYMKTFVNRIWTNYMLPELRNLYCDDFFSIIYTWTLGSVDMTTILLCAIQTEYLRVCRKNTKVSASEIVTAEMVEKIAEKNLTRMRALFRDGKVKSVAEYRRIRENFDAACQIEADKDMQQKAALQALAVEDVEAGYDHASKLYLVKTAIMDMFDFTEKQIDSAFCYCEKNTPQFKSFSDRQMKRVVCERLQARGDKRKTEKKKKADASITSMLTELKGVM